MGQAGAQREPSMEEILASIRRIIENNEPALDGSHGEAPAATATSYDDDDAYSDSHNIEEARQDAAPVVPADLPPSRPVSLAEVAALARTAPKVFDTRVEKVRPADDEPVATDDTVEIDEAAAHELREALASDAPLPASGGTETVRNEPGRKDAASVGSAQARDPAPAPVDVQSRESRAEALPPHSAGQLVSLQTGEKVAAAFGELDAAIAAGQRRSFDEIAEDMLRPMLTQWLDDNLPTLVERLVREEIERVSRGNRR